MKKYTVYDTEIKELKLVYPNKNYDNRGYLSELYNDDFPFQFPVKQVTESVSGENVFRGLHLQRGMAKAMKVIKGSALLISVDLFPYSATYKKAIVTKPLSKESQGWMLYGTDSIARGFIALEPDTTILYLQSDTYDESKSLGVNVFSPEFDLRKTLSLKVFGVDIDGCIMSDRDRNLPYLSDFKNPFL